MEQKNAVMKALKDWKSKLEKIQKSVTDSLEKAQDQLGSRIDQELKKTLDGTMKVMGSARSEIEEIQGVLKKMVTPVGKKASQKKKPAKKKPASPKKSVAKTAGSKKPGAESQAPASSVKAPAKKTPARKKASPAGIPSES